MLVLMSVSLRVAASSQCQSWNNVTVTSMSKTVSVSLSAVNQCRSQANAANGNYCGAIKCACVSFNVT